MHKHLVVFTGAGISAESGLQTFRDADGLWMGHDIQDVATPEAFARNPQLVLDFYNMRRREVAKAEPNGAHTALAALEKDFDVTIITQNIDDLHERGGSTNVIHLHGEIFKCRNCISDEIISEIRGDIRVGDVDDKGHQMRPHIVWFGEAVPKMEEAGAAVAAADIFLVIGSSLQVYPAAALLHFAPEDIPKYIIDKRIPQVSSVSNLHKIEKTAIEGMKEFAQRIKVEGGGME